MNEEPGSGPLEEEIVAVAKKVAEPETERRVLAAALTDVEVRTTLLRLQRPSPPSELRTVLQKAARQVAQEHRLAQVPWWQPFVGRLRRQFLFTDQILSLSALAPALAAPAATLRVERAVVEQEGIRIEFHQLPTYPPRLRILVEAQAQGTEAMEGVVLAFQEEGAAPFVRWISLDEQGCGRGEWEVGAEEPRGFPRVEKPLALVAAAVLGSR